MPYIVEKIIQNTIKIIWRRKMNFYSLVLETSFLVEQKKSALKPPNFSLLLLWNSCIRGYSLKNFLIRVEKPRFILLFSLQRQPFKALTFHTIVLYKEYLLYIWNRNHEASKTPHFKRPTRSKIANWMELFQHINWIFVICFIFSNCLPFQTCFCPNSAICI